jgi:DNA-directed RNA polymerase subunit RPC12/RpoP
MAHKTYGELFQESLEGLISAGGDVGTIVTLVNAYQRQDTVARHFAFEDWLDREYFICSGCGTAFKVLAHDAVEETDYVLCPKCGRRN